MCVVAGFFSPHKSNFPCRKNLILMSDINTKRTFSTTEADTTTTEETQTQEEPASKRPRVGVPEDEFRAATEILELDRVMDMLMRDLAATDKFFAAKPEEADRVATMLHRLGSRNPVTLAMLAVDSQLPLKKFIATVLMRGWLDLDELSDGLYLLPLFVVGDDVNAADNAMKYRTWLSGQATKTHNQIYTEFESFTVVEAAFATNNIPLLEWCRTLKNKLGDEIFDDNYWQLEESDDPEILKLGDEATRAWWATNVGELPEEDEEDKDEEDADDA